jgi:hypothetical protein
MMGSPSPSWSGGEGKENSFWERVADGMLAAVGNLCRRAKIKVPLHRLTGLALGVRAEVQLLVLICLTLKLAATGPAAGSRASGYL